MADSERHPFLQGLSKHRGAPPTVVVIFGASGDLTARKLIPAIYNLSYDNLLPADFYLVGYGRKPIPDERVPQDRLRGDQGVLPARAGHGGLGAASPRTRATSPAATTRRRASTGWPPTSRRSRRASAARCSRSSTSRRRPRCSSPIIQNLGASGLGGRYLGQAHHSKVIIEKPFGTDLDSARALNADAPLGLRGEPGVSNRPLPGQGDRAGPAGPALRELDLRADLEPQLHRQRPDHGRGGPGRRHARRATTSRAGACAT